MLKIKKSGCGISRCIICFFLALVLVNPGYAQTVSNMKSLLSKQGQVLFGNEPNSILIVDYPENIARVNEYLEMVDVQPRQVHIEARVVEVKLQGETSLGIDWTAFANSGGLNFGNFDMFSGTAASGIKTAGVIDYDTYSKIKDPPISGSSANTNPFTLTLSQNNIDVVMRALANDYDTDILSAPSVTTLNNHEAVIQMTDIYPWVEPTVVTADNATPEISYQINFEEAGIILKVTPTISEGGQIVMDLMPEISEKTDDYNVTTNSAGVDVTYTVPIIETRQARTKVVVSSGETLIIGGLIKNKEIESEIKIPLLGDIPYLGYLFKTQRKTMDKRELVIFVSPTIIGVPEIEYSGELEKKIRKDIEGNESKLEITPMKEVGPLKKQKQEALAVQEREKEAALATKRARQEEALQEKIDILYAQAVSLYADGQLKKAKSLFQKVLRYDSTHEKALNFLETKIPDGLKAQKVQVEASAEKVTRKIKVKPVQTESEDAAQKKQAAIARQKKRQAAKKAAELRRQTVLKAKKLYSSAVSLYKQKQYQAAYAKFQELSVFSPGYGRSEYYLAKIPGLIEAEALAKKEREAKESETALKAQVAESYRVAISLYKLKKYQEAYAKFKDIQKLSPGYRETTYYLNKIPEIIERKKRAGEKRYRAERQRVIKEMLDVRE